MFFSNLNDHMILWKIVQDQEAKGLVQFCSADFSCTSLQRDILFSWVLPSFFASINGIF